MGTRSPTPIGAGTSVVAVQDEADEQGEQEVQVAHNKCKVEKEKVEKQHLTKIAMGRAIDDVMGNFTGGVCTQVPGHEWHLASMEEDGIHLTDAFKPASSSHAIALGRIFAQVVTGCGNKADALTSSDEPNSPPIIGMFTISMVGTISDEMSSTIAESDTENCSNGLACSASCSGSLGQGVHSLTCGANLSNVNVQFSTASDGNTTDFEHEWILSYEGHPNNTSVGSDFENAESTEASKNGIVSHGVKGGNGATSTNIK